MSKTLPRFHIEIEILAVMAIFCVVQLLDGNMFGANEVDILPLAKQYADPTWLPGDWYLNQAPGYRLLFQILTGRFILAWGFLAVSIVGRLVCYGLVASGLVLISRKLGLSLPLLLLIVVLFMSYRSFTVGKLIVQVIPNGFVISIVMLTVGALIVFTRKRLGLCLLLLAFLLDPSFQSFAACHPFRAGLQPKVFAYGFVLLAIRLMLDGRYYWMALMLGLASSFHVLVGGWTFLTVLGWLVLRWKTRIASLRQFGFVLLIYLIAGIFAVKAVLEQLFTPNPTAPIATSYIYVFLRLPHHLNPLSWSSDWWIRLVVYLLVLAISVNLLRREQPSENYSEQHLARMSLFEFTLLSLIPFILGIAIAPFDSHGSLLQYYPFRLGGVMLPLNTYLLLGCVLEQTFIGRRRQLFLLPCIMLLSFTLTIETVTFSKQLLSLNQFPNQAQRGYSDDQSLCAWVRGHTPKNAMIVSPPGSFEHFTWLAERPTIAKFKLLPQNKTAIVEWYERLKDLSGNDPSLLLNPSEESKTQRKGMALKKVLDNGYNRLTTNQVSALMLKYRADYFIAHAEQRLDLPIAYRNSSYILYENPRSNSRESQL